MDMTEIPSAETFPKLPTPSARSVAQSNSDRPITQAGVSYSGAVINNVSPTPQISTADVKTSQN